MAALTHGPRLGAPSSGGFKVWVRADGAGTCVLEVRVNGASTWTTADTQSVDTSKYNTAVLTATGLAARTKYDYRVNVDGVNGITYTTITMPTSGRFVLYQISDTHGEVSSTTTTFASALTDYEANYEPSGIPGVVLCMGDFIDASGALDTRTDEFLAMLVLAAPTVRKLPLLFMWDDWDWGGNNSNVTYQRGYLPNDDHTVGENTWDRLWRDHPRPAAPSYGYEVVIADVPILVADSRSQKAPTATPASSALLFGAEPYSSSSTVYGLVQHEWLRARLIQYAERGLVYFVSTHTLRSNIIPYAFNGFGGAQRDSIGIFHKGTRNDLFSTAVAYGYGWRRNLVVLMGDDHRSELWEGDLGVALDKDDPGINRPGNGIGLQHIEIRGNGGTSGVVGASTAVFGYGNWFDWHGFQFDTFVRHDITSSEGGKHVSARFTFIHPSGAQNPPGANGIPTSTNGAGVGNLGDFYFDYGHLRLYSDLGTQYYPVENGTSEMPMDQRWYVDDINGHMFPEERAVRDLQARLRDKKDIGDVDRDDLLRDYVPRPETVDVEP